MMVFMYMFSLPVQVRGAESDEAREARLAQMRDHNAEVKHDNVVDIDDVHGHVLNGDVVYADPGMGGSVRGGKGGSACSDERSQC